MTRKFSHVAVLLGGWSAERPVSLSSGKVCADALESVGYAVTRIDVDRHLASKLDSVKPDAVFNALHGRWGEDGCVQGLLEVMGIPYSHSGVLSSSLAMHKQRAKNVMQAAGVPVAEGKVVQRREAAKAHVMAPPYVLKPVAEGSSFGVHIVREDHAHPPQELHAPDWAFGEELLAERYIAGRELTCAVIDDQPTDVIEILPVGLSFYNYESKYAVGGSKHVLPADISSKIYTSIQELTLSAHKALGCRGVSRADFRWDDRPTGSGELVCLEVNTQPGMTGTSLVPELAAHRGMSFGELVRWIVEDASLDR
jgi:D-alanine-D-alanine ligase